MIKELNELIWYAQRSVCREEELLASLAHRHPGVLALYQTLAAASYRSDAEAARGAGLGVTSYKKHGKLLREYLLDLVFFFDAGKARLDIRVKNLLEGRKNTAVAAILFSSGCRITSREVAKELLRKGLQFDCPDFVVAATQVLKECIIRVDGTEREYNHYNDLFWTYKGHLDLEQRAWEYYQRTRLPRRKKAGVRGSDATSAYLAELEPHVGTVPSFSFHLFYFLIRNQYHFEQLDYPGLLQACDEAISFFVGKKYPVTNPLSIFHYNKVTAYTMLGDYETGRAAAEHSLRYATEGTPNWFNALELFVYLALHTGHYDHAFDLCRQAMQHRRLAAMHPAQQETWRIIATYCYVLHRLGGIALPEGLPAFRSSRFLNEVPNFAQDKTGMNVAILIAHALLQLLEGKNFEAWSRIQALEKYRARHLRQGSDTARSVTFIRILLLLPRTNYHRSDFLQKAGPLLQQLAGLPRRLNHALELEIVPYEELTRLVGNYLGSGLRSRSRAVG